MKSYTNFYETFSLNHSQRSPMWNAFIMGAYKGWNTNAILRTFCYKLIAIEPRYSAIKHNNNNY